MAGPDAPDLMDGILDTAADVAKRGLLAVAIALTGVLISAGGGAVAGIAAYMWLSRHLPDYLAALCISAVLLVIGICLLVGGKKPVQKSMRRQECPPGAGDPIAHLARGVAAAFQTKTASHPTRILVTAAVLGFVTGLLGRRGKT